MEYFIEIEKADGTLAYYKDGLAFEDKDDADERAEFLWNLHAHTGNYARFSVIGSDKETYSDWEC